MGAAQILGALLIVSTLRAGVAHSLRDARYEPAGSFQTAAGTKFSVPTDKNGVWERIEQSGQSAEYRVEYVISAGKHASGYLVRVGHHLFQSRIGFYTSRQLYDHPAVLAGFGTALLQGNQPCEAKTAFNRLLALDQANRANQENAGRAELACGDVRAALEGLEKAMDLDPLALSAAEVLDDVYRKTGDYAKQEALSMRIRESMRAVPVAGGNQ